MPGHVGGGPRDGALDQLALHQYAKGVGVPGIEHNDSRTARNQRFQSRDSESMLRACLLDGVQRGPHIDNPAHAAPPSTLKGKGLKDIDPSDRWERYGDGW